VPFPPLCAGFEGYTLHAGVSIPAHRRDALERLCRYILRPPLARTRLSLRDGLVVLQLKRAWHDGTTEKTFTTMEFTERISALIPPPHSNQVLYHGVLASQSRLRRAVVPRSKPPRRRRSRRVVQPRSRAPMTRWLSWAELLKRTFDVDGFQCPRCGGRMRLHAVVLDATVARKVLRDLVRTGAGPPERGSRTALA
jgi:hypothetical protein